MSKTDFLGNPLELNDWVVFELKHYRCFFIGKIVKFTDKTVLIRHKHYQHVEYYSETRQDYAQVIKITSEQVGDYMFDETKLKKI